VREFYHLHAHVILSTFGSRQLFHAEMGLEGGAKSALRIYNAAIRVRVCNCELESDSV
jgi:hypothetical protein